MPLFRKPTTTRVRLEALVGDRWVEVETALFEWSHDLRAARDAIRLVAPATKLRVITERTYATVEELP